MQRISARTGIVEIKRRFSALPAPNNGPPAQVKPATGTTAAGLEVVSTNEANSAYHSVSSPATVNERQAWHAVRFFNSAPKLTREARRVGIALVVLARAVRSGEAGGEQIATEAGLSTGKTVAGLHALAAEGLISKKSHGFSLNWEALS